jgi:hypothetical protein
VKIVTLILCLALTGCGLTPRQKAVIGGIALTSLALSLNKSDKAADPTTVQVGPNPCVNPEACR